MMVNLSREIGIVLLRALEYNLGAIGEFVGSEIDLSEAALSDEAAESIVADSVEFRRREFAE